MFQLHNMGKDSEVHYCQVADHLGCLMEMIIWSSPVQDPHPEQTKENWIIDSGLVHLSKPFGSSDHVGPKPIIKEEIRIDILPPLVVGSLLILSSLLNPMEGILGDLQFSVSISTSRNEEGNYLISQQVMTITWWQSVFPVVPLTDVPQEPASG